MAIWEYDPGGRSDLFYSFYDPTLDDWLQFGSFPFVGEADPNNTIGFFKLKQDCVVCQMDGF